MSRYDFSIKEYRKKLINLAYSLEKEQKIKRDKNPNYPQTETGDDREVFILRTIANDLTMIEAQDREVSYWDY